MIRRRAIAGFVLCLTVAAGGAIYAGFLDDSPAAACPDAGGSLREPGASYEIVANRYKYYGGLKDQIENDPDNSMGPERQVFTVRISVAPDGQTLTTSTTITDIDGNPLWPSHIIDLETTASISQAVPPEDERPDLVQVYLELGFAEVEIDRCGARIFEIVEEYSDSEKETLFQPIRDLDPVSSRVRTHVDPRNNILTAYFRYVTDAAGTETLVESGVTTIERLD